MFQRPEAFLLLFLFFLVIWFRRRRKKLIGVPNLSLLKEKVPSASWTKRNLVPLLGVLTFSFFVVAFANPMYSVQRSREVKETRLIVLVEDLSASMDSAIDNVGTGSSWESKYSSSPMKHDVALDAAQHFVNLRSNDYIALTAFADYAKLACPFTIDHNIIRQKLDDIRPGTKYNEDMDIGSCTNASEAIWLAISLFINYLPKEDRPSIGEIMDMRSSLIGTDNDGELYIPPSLRGKNFGRGKIMVFFSDGDFYVGPQGINVIKSIRLMRYLGIRGYFLLTNKNVDEKIKHAITLADKNDLATAGMIFLLEPNLGNINTVYTLINDLEKTKIILEGFEDKKSSSEFFTLLGVAFFLGYIFLKYNRKLRKPEM